VQKRLGCAQAEVLPILVAALARLFDLD